MINSVTIIGRLTKDVDLRYTKEGKAVGSFTVACNRPFKNAQGQQEADFINVVEFGKGAENTAQYMKKGSLIGVTGRIQTRNYQNNEGRTVYVTEVVANNVAFLESRKQQNNQPSNQSSDPFANAGNQVDLDDSSLPF